MSGLRGRLDTLQDGRRWLAVRNDSGEAIPAFAVMEITGTASRDGRLVLTVTKPTGVLAASMLRGDRSRLLVNGPRAIPTGGYGSGTIEEPLQVLREPGSFGVASGSWSLSDAAPMFDILGQTPVPRGSSAVWVASRGGLRGVYNGNGMYGTIADGDVLVGFMGTAGTVVPGYLPGAGVVDTSLGGFKSSIDARYLFRWSSSLWSDDANVEGTWLELGLVVTDDGGTPPGLPSSAVGARVQSIDADGVDLGYGTGELRTIEMVSIEAVIDLDAGESLGLYNQTGGGFSINFGYASFAAELLELL